MKRANRLTLLSLLGLIFAACYQDRPLIVAENDANASSGAAGTTASSTGAAGTTPAAAGTTASAAGTTAGAAGSTAAAGITGTGVGAPGCDIKPLVTKYSCTLAGACHDSRGSAANFDMSSPGWEQNLVGAAPRGGGPSFDLESVCANQGWVYLVPGSSPATGLFMEKFKTNPSCGMTMPNLGVPVSADDLGCFQRWADALVAQAGAGGRSGAAQ